MKPFIYHTTSQTILADLYTPVGIYMRLRDLYPQSALMESSDYHDRDNSRSFIAIHPMASVAVGHGMAEIQLPDGSREHHAIDEDYGVAQAIHALTDRLQVEGPEASLMGLYGYTSFNAVRYFEHINVKDETQAENDAPDVLYILYRTVIALDHFSNRLTIATLSEGPEPQAGTEATDNTELNDILRALDRSNVHDYDFRPVGPVRSTLSDDEHRENIRRGIRHCLRGDVFQIVLSRRFVQPFEGDDFRLYRALRSINPSPYLFYFDFGGFRIFGSSPETHCRITRAPACCDSAPARCDSDSVCCDSGSVCCDSVATYQAYIDPIAGTTRRTGNAEADRQAAEYLRNDPKENAEHVMLVDLARNDLSRNCHDVHVDFYKDLQYYSHVVHLVSRVSGTLDPNTDPIQTFIDTFPAGTLSGAPKVRAMQLISDYEPHNRGAYGGCIGVIGLDGTLNQAITIRTFVSRNGELWFQAGGGIVAKSNVEYELQEVNNKLGALRHAIDLAATL